MCKNLSVVGIKSNKQKEAWQFLHKMAPLMTKGDDDGLGYAAMTSRGMYGERWLHTNQAFHYRKAWSQKDQQLKDDFKGLLEGGPSYNAFAEDKKLTGLPVTAVIMHARWATGEVALKNVHPFYRDGTAIIHNGVINNAEKLKMITSTCDSETILNSYVDNKVNVNPANIDSVSKELRGYYGCIALSKDATGRPIMDIFRGPEPYIYACYIKELDALVFCTSALMVIEACKELKWNHHNFFLIKENSMMRMDASTGKLISGSPFIAQRFDTHNHNGYDGENSQSWMAWQERRDKELAEEAEQVTSDSKKSKEVEDNKVLTQEETEEARSGQAVANFCEALSPKQRELAILQKTIGESTGNIEDEYIASGMKH